MQGTGQQEVQWMILAIPLLIDNIFQILKQLQNQPMLS